MYNIVTRQSLIQELKKSKYWRQNLGVVTTLEHNGQRRYNEKDKFSFFYNTQYKTNIQMQGTIGNIVIYLDYYIHEDVVALYYNTEEFVFQWDSKMVNEKGIDFYLGHLLKTMETQHEERIKKAEEKDLEVKKVANPDLITTNPGLVTYEDLKAYLAEKGKNRLGT
jgi:hypothetical protein